MNRGADVAIVGAGIIGASIAWKLAGGGLRVLLIDAGRMGGEASWAGAGMLAPGGELDQAGFWSDFAMESLRMYPSYVADLADETGAYIDFRRSGALEIARSEEEWLRLAERAGHQREIGIRVEPGPRPNSLFYPDDALVDPRNVIRALRLACVRRGVQIIEDSPVSRIDVGRNSVAIDGNPAGFAVLAAGAWSSSIPVFVERNKFSLPPVRPVRGHLLGYNLPQSLLGPILRHEHTYILQRSTGFTVAGTSTEDVGYDRTIDSDIVAGIRKRAESLLPELQSASNPEVWIGFRPGADQPVISRVADSNLWLAYGHYRNGILLAPATADRVSDEIITAR